VLARGGEEAVGEIPETFHAVRLAGRKGPHVPLRIVARDADCVLPDLGSSYPGNDALGDSANHFERTIDDVSTIFTNGTISMTLGHTDVAVRVVPMDHPASYQDVEPFAGLMIKHAAKYLPH